MRLQLSDREMTGSLLSAAEAGLVRLGSLRVNRLGYGAMRLTGDGFWGEPEKPYEAIKLLQRAVNLGINFIDTADAYGPEVSENLIYRALYPYKHMVIATKGGLVRSGPGRWSADCSSRHLRQACESSLKRLHLDSFDLYQLHTVDPKVPFEESFLTLIDLQSEGKIRHIGLSNIEPKHFAAALDLGNFVSVQNNYNVFNREHEDILRLCDRHGMTFIPYFPIGGNESGGLKNRLINQLTRKYNATAYQIALAWLLDHSPNILPIPGTSSIDHLAENLKSVLLDLDQEDIDLLNNIAQNVS